MTKKHIWIYAFILLGLLMCAPVYADTVHQEGCSYYLFDEVFPADDPPNDPDGDDVNDDGMKPYPYFENNPPWLKATFEENDNNNDEQVDDITLTLDSRTQNLEGGAGLNPDQDVDDTEHVKAWYFNFSLNPSNLTITQISGVASSNISAGLNQYNADGGGKFDIRIEFPTNMFTAESYAEFEITYDPASSLKVHSFFDSLSVEGGHGNYLAAAHLGGLANGDSTWIYPTGQPVPEPATLLLLGLGLVGLSPVVKRFARKTPTDR